jgi:NAD(P)-dependent dehydrogenase (short-subunit alcohol dehydrogenase family)
MKATGGGKIINIGSMMSIFGASFAPAYAASKGGIVQFTRSCAVAWAPDNIQANAILPIRSSPRGAAASASLSFRQERILQSRMSIYPFLGDLIPLRLLAGVLPSQQHLGQNPL